MKQPVPDMMSRLKTSFSWGPIVGLIALFYTILEALSLFVTEKLFPENDIDISRNFNTQTYNVSPQEYGSHEVYVNTSDIRHKPK